jgi:hypothetical protein
MTANRRRPLTTSLASAFRNLVGGGMGPLERVQTIGANIRRRGGTPRADCCGHYGEPGC